jgi:hypothetical protein
MSSRAWRRGSRNWWDRQDVRNTTRSCRCLALKVPADAGQAASQNDGIVDLCRVELIGAFGN